MISGHDVGDTGATLLSRSECDASVDGTPHDVTLNVPRIYPPRLP